VNPAVLGSGHTVEMRDIDAAPVSASVFGMAGDFIAAAKDPNDTRTDRHPNAFAN
jgi:hypothetical protein